MATIHFPRSGSALVCFIALLFLVSLCVAQERQAARIDGVRIWTAPEYTRLVLDLSASRDYHIFSLTNPNRLVIDLRNTQLKTTISQPKVGHRVLRSIRQGIRDHYDLRLVLDLKRTVRTKSYALIPNARYGQRLVIDLYDSPWTAAPLLIAKPKFHTRSKIQSNAWSQSKSTYSVPAKKLTPTPPQAPVKRAREVVIAIDAGHGGEDPGAIGVQGIQEKDVVLAIARKLQWLVKREYGMRPVMIRSGDYYVKLRDRMVKARNAEADLFISIHADAFKNHKAKGASVYVLSQGGANQEANRFLLAQEKASDQLGGAVVEGKEKMVKALLLNLSQVYTQTVSEEVANKVLDSLKHLGSVHKPNIQKAAFVVLKSPDVPSLLVETAFITNPGEAQKLQSSNHQQKLAKSIMRGIRGYFLQKPPPGTLLAARKGLIAKATEKK